MWRGPRLLRRSLVGGGLLGIAGALLGWRGAGRAAPAAGGPPLGDARRRAAAGLSLPQRSGRAAEPAYDGHGRRGRSCPQRLRPASAPDRLGSRGGLDAAGRPHPARVRDHRGRSGGRDRARRVLPGLVLQRPRARADAARDRGRAGPHPLRQRRQHAAYDALPRHPLGAHGWRARRRRGAARASASSTSSRPGPSAATSTTAIRCR